MSSRYPILDNRPIDQWKVTELKEELKRRKLTTRGLKDDLIKRLDEAIRSEVEKVNLTSDNGFDCAPQPEFQPGQQRTETFVSENAQNSINLGHNTNDPPKDNSNEKQNEVMEPQGTYQQERMDVFVSETVQVATNHDEHISEKLDDNLLEVDINDNTIPVNEGKFEELQVAECADSAGLETEQVTQITVEETTVEETTQITVEETTQITVEETTEIVSGNAESVTALSGQDFQNNVIQDDSGDVNAQLESDDSKPLLVDATVNASDPNNQVSEVSPVLGFQVKSDSISTESVSINEKNELKDNIIADDVKIELDVKPEMVQPSSTNVVPDGGKSHPTDVEEPQANKVSVEETGGDNAENLDIIKKNDTGELGYSEKLNLDRISGDDFMEEDVVEGRQIDSKSNFDEIGDKAGKIEALNTKEESLVDIVGEDKPAEKVENIEEKNGPAAPPMKRKLNDQQAAGYEETTKRQRRWNSEGLKVSEPPSPGVVSATPKGAFQPALRRSFSRSDSTVSEEVQKERVVPPSSKPPTNSLRIDRFLRPFTLKAVQELLGKTGSVIDFWMDHIKTHCYVSYSSVEEAVETRNAVYNLQWPPNGGRLLAAEFVDPQEVKSRLEPPAKSPAAPVSSHTGIPPAPQTVQTQPSPRQQVQKHQPQTPALPPPPPPPLSNSPSTREHLPPVRERLTLPPPPPLNEKADPPIVTLDDLFRKTKATPRIYYLPLSEEQVAAKLQAQGKAVKQ